jgi:hypothetical protein
VIGSDQIAETPWDKLLTCSVLRSLATILHLWVTPSGAIRGLRATTDLTMRILGKMTQKVDIPSRNMPFARPRIVERSPHRWGGGSYRYVLGRDGKGLGTCRTATVALSKPRSDVRTNIKVQVPRGAYVVVFTIGRCGV